MAWLEPISNDQQDDPDTMSDWQIVYYFMVATLTAYVWDWILSLSEEYAMLEKSGWRVPNIVYMISRFGTIAYCISVVVGGMTAAAIDQRIFFISWSMWEISALGTYCLFFIRVCAIYQHTRMAVLCFGTLCAAIVLFPVCFLLGIRNNQMMKTARFAQTPPPFYDGVATVLPAINDTVIYFSISIRLISDSLHDSIYDYKGRLRAFITGDGLQSLSKTLLQSGQAYYGVTIIMTVVAIALLASPSLPATFGSLLGPAHTALSSAMACRVYRSVLLFSDEDDNLDHSMISLAFRAPTHTEFPLTDIASQTATRCEPNGDYHAKYRSHPADADAGGD